jgi:prepilin-type processing-associated H-X9-DG protein
MLLPALAKAKQKSQGIYCMNNTKHMAMSWIMYSDDNNGILPPNRDGGNVGKSAADAAWVGGWLDFNPGNPDNINTGYLVQHDTYPYAAFLGPYIKTFTAFKCPADRSVVNINGKSQSRVRSLSMNSYVGTLSRTWTSPSKYKQCQKYTDIKSPVMMFVFLDEREDSINDGWFATDPDTMWQLIDYPASYHGRAAGFSFADGHSEIHRWVDGRTMPVLQPGTLLPLNVNLGGDKDVPWLSQRAAGQGVYP